MRWVVSDIAMIFDELKLFSFPREELRNLRWLEDL